MQAERLCTSALRTYVEARSLRWPHNSQCFDDMSSEKWQDRLTGDSIPSWLVASDAPELAELHPHGSLLCRVASTYSIVGNVGEEYWRAAGEAQISNGLS